MIEGFEKANIGLARETKFTTDNALFYSKSKKNLMSFKVIRCNGYHIETHIRFNGNHIETHIRSVVSQRKI